MIPLLAGVFVSSLVGSLHCMGMCGGLVAAAEGMHSVYHGARLLAYVVLGALVGSLGAVVNFAVGPVAAWIAGGVLILWGIVSLARLAGLPARWKMSGSLALRLTRGIRRRSPIARAAILGAVSGLLPCGWLYAFVVLASGTGGPATGALVMSVFWLGTVPALLGLGLGLRHLALRVQKVVPWVAAVCVLAVGLTTIVYRSHLQVGKANACCHEP